MLGAPPRSVRIVLSTPPIFPAPRGDALGERITPRAPHHQPVISTPAVLPARSWYDALDERITPQHPTVLTLRELSQPVRDEMRFLEGDSIRCLSQTYLT